MKLDPGIYIVMHSILSLKPGVTAGHLGWAPPPPVSHRGGREVKPQAIGRSGRSQSFACRLRNAQQPGQDSCSPIQDSKFDFVAVPRRLHLSRTLQLLFPMLMQGSGAWSLLS
jgi:hypothetical protein